MCSSTVTRQSEYTWIMMLFILWRGQMCGKYHIQTHFNLTNYISEFKDDGLSADNKILFFSNLCQCVISSKQTFLVPQHIKTCKHKNKQQNSKQKQFILSQTTISNYRSKFSIDLCRSLISADTPLHPSNTRHYRR